MNFKSTLQIFLTCFAIIGSSFIVNAQKDTGKEKTSKQTKTESLTSDKKASKQNQEQFLGDQQKTEDYKYEDRIKISKAVMPSLDSDSAAFINGEKKKTQQKAFSSNQYYYPSKPKNQWDLGAHLGSLIVSGDVNPLAAPWKSFGLGVSARRSFGYVFSLRMQYMFGRSQGRDWVPNWNLSANNVLNGGQNPALNYNINKSLRADSTVAGVTTEGAYFHNYRMTSHELSLQGMVTFGNIKFHQERTLINFNLYGGLGGMLYNTKTDALDANGNIYDLSPALSAFYGPDRLGSGNKGDVLDALNTVRDGKYETDAESNGNDIGNFGFIPTFQVGGAIGFHLSKRFTLSVDSRITFTIDDLLDGNQWQVQQANGSRETRGLTRDYDNLFFTSVGIHVHLGKNAIEPLYWMNPMDFTYKKLGEMDPEKAIDDLLKDDDEDGVPNRLDMEENTVSGAPVDPKGIALDSDKDGIIDLLDLEPFSPPGYPIDDNGIAQIPEQKLDQEMIQQSLNCDQVELPSIHYELDKYYIRPEYYAHLHLVAEKMQLCPNLRVSAVGRTDIRNSDEYNQQLSWNRVNEAINYLVEKYGIDRGRFLVKFEGEEKAEEASSEFGHLLNRKVDFRVAGPTDAGESDPAMPFPKIKAGSNKR